MINLKTNCEDCTHAKVCKNRDNAKSFKNHLLENNYGLGPNDDYDWNTMSDCYHVNVDISCPDFEKSIPVPRAAFNK